MGTYDTVHYRCPACDTSLMYQSKAGPCELNHFALSSAPLSIAGAMMNATEVCYRCGVVIQFAPAVTQIPMAAVIKES